jgi:hypothetical protein
VLLLVLKGGFGLKPTQLGYTDLPLTFSPLKLFHKLFLFHTVGMRKTNVKMELGHLNVNNLESTLNNTLPVSTLNSKKLVFVEFLYFLPQEILVLTEELILIAKKTILTHHTLLLLLMLLQLEPLKLTKVQVNIIILLHSFFNRCYEDLKNNCFNEIDC